MGERGESTTGQRIGLVVAVVVLNAHLVAGISALALLPHGFAATNAHLWSNTVIPATTVLATAAVVVRYLFFRSSPVAVAALVSAAAGGWTGAVVLGAVLFPVSMPPSRLAGPAAVALALLGVAWWVRPRTAGAVGAALAALAGAVLGGAVVFAQRAPPPSTRPSGGTPADVRGPASSDEAATGQIVVACGKEKIRLNPLLTFQSRSPDRTWTLLAPPDALGPHRTLSHYAKTPSGFRASFADDGESTLIATRDNKNGLEVDVVSKLPSPVYSHLNTWTIIHFSFEAALAFGPTGVTRFPIEPSDYPSGRPAQLAVLGEDLTFRVARARDAEKGPYTELAKGRLGRDEPLTIEIRPRDESHKGCRLIFKDWSAQVSTDASPTAGWGLPQNSIQFFSRGGEALIALVLAETGPGRGFDSVGHAEGTYRNRLRVEPIR